MRMHPRRNGAANLSARFASAFVNYYTREKKKQRVYDLQQKARIDNSNKENKTSEDTNIGCMVIAGIFIFIMICLFNT